MISKPYNKYYYIENIINFAFKVNNKSKQSLKYMIDKIRKQL